MAQPIPCDQHTDRLAYILLTRLSDGETLSLCEECWQGLLLAAGRGVEAATDALAVSPDVTSPAQPESEPSEETSPFPAEQPPEEATTGEPQPAQTAGDKRTSTRPHGRPASGGAQTDGRPGADLDTAG
jgi:hypothetical protein